MRTVADTILAQLGGARFIAMTGARQFVGYPDALIFGLPGSLTKGRINKCRVVLRPDDLYDVECYRLVKHDALLVADATCADVASLGEVFESLTGLRVSL